MVTAPSDTSICVMPYSLIALTKSSYWLRTRKASNSRPPKYTGILYDWYNFIFSARLGVTYAVPNASFTTSTWGAEMERKSFVSCRLSPLSVTIVSPKERGCALRPGILSRLKFIAPFFDSGNKYRINNQLVTAFIFGRIVTNEPSILQKILLEIKRYRNLQSLEPF